MSGRMLLSHNYNLVDAFVPALSAAEFAQVFIDGFGDRPDITVAAFDHPHWRVEVTFEDGDNPSEAAAAVGRTCAEILMAARLPQTSTNSLDYDTLILGGQKLTPPTGPTGLQTGEWGVDVVETPDADAFLASINWTAISSTKQPGQVFSTIARKGQLDK